MRWSAKRGLAYDNVSVSVWFDLKGGPYSMLAHSGFGCEKSPFGVLSVTVSDA